MHYLNRSRLGIIVLTAVNRNKQQKVENSNGLSGPIQAFSERAREVFGEARVSPLFLCEKCSFLKEANYEQRDKSRK